eukprot:2795322-Alexandrium_andersonii.AAC.1
MEERILLHVRDGPAGKIKRDFYRSRVFQDVHHQNVERFRALVAKRMTSYDDLWGVDTLAWREFERMFEQRLLERFAVLP